jgi:hypothetical protein
MRFLDENCAADFCCGQSTSRRGERGLRTLRDRARERDGNFGVFAN